jgi:hypothetical protein
MQYDCKAAEGDNHQVTAFPTDRKDWISPMNVKEPTFPQSVDSYLVTVSGFLNTPGESLMGLDMTEGEAIAFVKSHFPNKPYCLVSNWMLIKMDADERSLKAIQRIGSEPYLVYAHNVLQDSAGRFYRGQWVRSTLQVSFTHGGLFETVNTVYVLVGPGLAKTADPDVVMSIHG